MTAEAPATLRLFVAVELPDAVRDALARTIEALRRAAPEDALRWVRPEGIHITLKFLGATPAERVEAINTALRLGLQGAAAFELRAARLGSFGGRRNLRVVWLALDDAAGALPALAARVETALAPLGFPTEARAFNAHLTLARVREDTPPDERARLHERLHGAAPPETPPFRVDHVSLMQSTLGRGGSVYRALATFPLADA